MKPEERTDAPTASDSKEARCLVLRLERLGVRLWVDGEKLRFKAPRGVLTARWREQVALLREDVIAFVRSRTSEDSRRVEDGMWSEPCRVRSHGGPSPLSFAQQRLWFMHQLAPQSAFYNMPAVLRLKGRLDVGCLEAALSAVVQRQEALRTTFPAPEGQAIQLVHPFSPVQLPVVEIPGPSPSVRREQALQVAEQEVRRPFDLATGPLVRFSLLRVDPEDHLLVVTLHHIISDGWSLGVLLREILTLLAPDPIALPVLPLQYADYAQWQRSQLQGVRLEQLLQSWKEALCDAPVVSLPHDRPRKAGPGFRGRHHRFEVPAGILGPLRSLAREQQATLFMTLLTAFDILLSRWTGQSDVCVGTAVANRNYAAIEPLLGFFVNTLALRTDLSGDPTVEQALGRVRRTALHAYANQDLPFEMLVDELGTPRVPGHNPLFPVMIVLQNTPKPSPGLRDLSIETVPLELMISKFDLTLEVTETGETLSCVFEYDSDLFEESTIRQLERQYVALLQQLPMDPSRRVSSLVLGSAQDMAGFVWTGPDFSGESGPPLYLRLAEHARERPADVAVQTPEGPVRHCELQKMVEGLANQLCAEARPGSRRLAICCRNPAWQVAGMVAALRRGAAFVPLDSGHPRARIDSIVAHAEVTHLLTDWMEPANASSLTTLWTVPAETLPVVVSEEVPGPRELAYVVYTSGSTGVPKGVGVEHGSLDCSLLARRVHYRERPSTLVAWLSPAFDAGVGAILWALDAGATLRVVPVSSTLDPGAVRAAIESDTASHLVTTPSLYQLLLEDPGAPGSLASLKQVVLGGESCPVELANLHRRALPNTALSVEYGPTEATIWATVQDVVEGCSSLPLGKPIAGTRVYLLRDNLMPAAPGELAEIFLGGAGVALGYLGDPRETARRFLPDPFAAEPGARMLRTGDLARRTGEGQLVFAGRRDGQVKIRGVRVDVGEVEAALASHPAVGEAVVDQVMEGGEPTLCAYVRLHPGFEPAVGAPLAAAQVSSWRSLYDERHEQPSPADPRFDIRGWSSSLTGEPYGAEEMRAWQAQTMSRLRALRPRRVLELGCGTGLLLFPLLDLGASVDGVDFSEPVLEQIRKELSPAERARVRLFCRDADALEALPDDDYDLVVINSVTQYFPGVDHLLRVLDGALRRVRCGGHVFVGDVRNRALLDAFHMAVQLDTASEETSFADVVDRAKRMAALESELLVDPRFFDAYRAASPVPIRARSLAKTGPEGTEMNLYRFDCILERSEAPKSDPEQRAVVVRWGKDVLDLARLEGSARSLAREGEPIALWVKGLRDRRIAAEVFASRWMREGRSGFATVGDWKRARLGVLEGTVDLAALEALGQTLACGVQVGPADASGESDAVLLLNGARQPEREQETQAPYLLANDPLRGKREVAAREVLPGHLAKLLPPAMVPARFAFLDRIPRGTSGKIDREALRRNDPQTTLREHAPARDDVERAMVAVWKDVLEREDVGIHDNFFELGGDSIRAVQVSARARSRGIQVNTQDVFLHQSIAALARSLRDATSSPGLLPEALPKPVVEPALLQWAESRFSNSVQLRRLSPIQQGMLFHTSTSASPSMYLTQIVLRLSGPLEADLLEQSWNHVLEAHPALRASFHAVGAPEPLLVVHERVRVRMDREDARDMAEDAAEHWVRELLGKDRTRPLDLESPPPMRLCLVRMPRERWRLTWTTHHVVLDGWSAAQVIGDVADTYDQLLRGRAPTLPVVDGPALADAVFCGADMSGSRSFWSRMLEGLPEATPLPPRTRNEAPSDSGRVSLALTTELTRRLSEEARSRRLTLNTFVQAAWALCLASTTGLQEVTFGTTLSVRPEDQADAERAVGLFINTLPFRVRFDRESTVAGWLASLQASHMEIRAQGGTSLGDIRRFARLGTRPLFSSVLIYENAPRPGGAIHGDLVLEGVEDFAVAHYPLVLVAIPPDDRHVHRLELRAGYDGTHVCSEVAGDLLRRMESCLQRLVSDPGAPVGKVLETVVGLVHERNPGERVVALEDALLRHPGVRECAVILRKRHDGVVRPVAYVVTDEFEPGASSLGGLPEELARSGSFPGDAVVIDSLPWLADGRVDVDALSTLPVLDRRTVEEVQRRIEAEVGGACAACVGVRKNTIGRLHLSQILPGWRRFEGADHDRGGLPSCRAREGLGGEAVAPAMTEETPLTLASDAPCTLPQALVLAASEHPDHGVSFLEDGGQRVERIGYPELLSEAKRVAGGLIRVGVVPGSFVILQCRRNRDVLTAFWGCTLAGLVPVPLAVPGAYDCESPDLSKLESACRLLGRPCLLADRETLGDARGWVCSRGLAETTLVELDGLRDPHGLDAFRDGHPDDAALLLLTSASTGPAKVVLQTHRTLLARCQGANQANSVGPKDVGFNWMPLNHVGGIVSMHLQDVVAMCNEVHVPMGDVLAEPLLWLDGMDRFRATMTWAPNFAFGLVASRLQEDAAHRWDLRSLRLVVNAGETIVVSTARQFLRRLSSSGLSPHAMVPGWGMSETCSGTVYSHGFQLEGDEKEGPYVDLGEPIPGFRMRVVDAMGRVLGEGETGHLEVRGAPVTPGYYDVGELNAKAFTPDGWFRTGDMATIRGGRLTLTGRRADQIVVDGVNYHAHEIESAVEELDVVVPSFTAACAVPDPQGGERLAIFVAGADGISLEASDEVALLARTIRQHLVVRVGINPKWVVPLRRDQVPKTDIGKVKRASLARDLLRGEFDSVLDLVDLGLGSDDTLEDWFWQRSWCERAPRESKNSTPSGRWLVFGDDRGMAETLADLWGAKADDWVSVRVGADYDTSHPNRIFMDPSDPSHYERLAQDLKLDRNPVARVMHLWGYGSARGTLERSVVSALLSLQMVLRHQAVEKFSFAAVTARGQCLFPEDSCDSFLAALGGLLRTIPLELPEVESLWVDVEGEDVEVDARRVVAEVQGGGREREVAYRGEKRWVPILRRAVGTRRLGHAPMVVRRGLVLVTGGLGGLGRLLARFLIEQYESKVLLVGRTAVSGESSAEQERKEALLALESRSSFVRYVALDVCDPGAVQAAVAKAERDWSTPLSTAFHLAGHGNVRSHWEASERHRIREESLESLREMLRARVFGAKAVQQVLADRPESSYVAFSSVHGTFGGATLASYAAASSFLDTDTLAWAARHGRRGMCVGWSSWRETGMSRNAPESAGRLAEASGFRQIDPERGLRSLRVALEQGLSHVLIGVDATRPHVARRAEYSGKPSRELLLCHTGHAPASLLDQGPLVDRFGVRIPLRLVTVPRIPRTEEGDVDTVVLSAVALADPDRGGQREATTATQRALVDVFRKVLGVGRGVDVRDNFFDLGADSLRLVKAHALITHDLGVSLSLVDLFRHTTIEKLAAFLDHGVLGGAEREDAGREVAEQRLHRQERRRSRLRGKVNGTDEPRGDDED